MFLPTYPPVKFRVGKAQTNNILIVAQHVSLNFELPVSQYVSELLPVDKERKQHAVGTESPCAFSSIQDDLPNQLCVEAAVQDPTEWPALSATEVPVQEHDSTIALFSDIVQTIQDKVDASEVPAHKITVKREKPTMTKKKNKQVPCYNCPNCRVCCSSEDAMLDHFIRKHSSLKVDRPDTLYNQEDEINVPSNIHCHRDTEETPQQDDNAANEDQVNVPSHFFFQRDTDETPQQDREQIDANGKTAMNVFQL
ncbi:hypothetical protein DPMN_086279 [Dreissena polymorpha]|uniref:C2H2-type domain-containing protein n=1 Tax=Dreissena polymorpha TaxID=45954 RepID=A0A9D4KQ49_DREPO|nr:hypothetical protein DPMN_086279 [Dreissena polymorpha]